MAIQIKKRREIIGFGQSKDLDLLMFMKEKSRELMGLSQSKGQDFNSELVEKRWV